MFFLLPPLPVLGTQAPPQVIVQKTSGWCSPAIANVIGNVTVTCIGVDPLALQRLNKELAAKKMQRDQAVRMANDWVEKYKDLDARLTAAGKNDRLSKQAEEYLHRGQLEQAGRVLDQILGQEDQSTERSAEDHYNRGLTFELAFQPLKALPQFKTAYQLAKALDKEDAATKYSVELARLLMRENNNADAEAVARQTIDDIRSLPVSDANRDKEVSMLIMLGNLCSMSGRLDEAESYFKQAIKVYGGPLKSATDSFAVDRAILEIDLAGVYARARQSSLARQSFLELLPIVEQLASADPDCAPYVAGIQTNLGILDSNEGLYTVAEQEMQLALKILETVRARDSFPSLLMDISKQHERLGGLYEQMKQPVEAEQEYKQELKISQDLAKENPDAYDKVVASAQCHLADVYADTERAKEAESEYLECISILKKYSDSTAPDIQVGLAAALGNLAGLYSDSNRDADSLKYFLEAKEVFSKMKKMDRDQNRPQLALVLRALARAYRDEQYDEKAVDAYTESLEILHGLAGESPEEFDRLLADTLLEFGRFEIKRNAIADASKSISEAVELNRTLMDSNSEESSHALAESLVAAIWVQQSENDKCKLAAEAVRLVADPELKQAALKAAGKDCSSF